MFGKILLGLSLLLLVSAQSDLLKNVTSQEMDKMMSCSYITGGRLNADREKLIAIIEKIGKEKAEKFQNKISYDIFEFCYNKIDNQTVASMFDNLTFVSFDWNKKLEKFSEVNYDAYDNTTSLELSMSQMTLGMKFEQVKELFEAKKLEIQREERNTIKVGGYDINKIPSGIKMIFFLCVFGGFGLAMMYLLGKVMNKPKENKKKNRKQK